MISVYRGAAGCLDNAVLFVGMAMGAALSSLLQAQQEWMAATTLAVPAVRFRGVAAPVARDDSGVCTGDPTGHFVIAQQCDEPAVTMVL